MFDKMVLEPSLEDCTALTVEAKRRTKKLLLYELKEAFEIDLCHEFQLYTFARSSSDNFSPTRKSNT